MCYLWESLLYTIGTIDKEALEYLQLESLATENAGNQGNVVILRNLMYEQSQFGRVMEKQAQVPASKSNIPCPVSYLRYPHLVSYRMVEHYTC
jgi:hypothetical protein